MPIRVRADSELGLSVVTFEGVVTASEFERHIAPLVDDSEVVLMPRTLVDTTGASHSEGSLEGVRRVARRVGDRVDHEIEPGARLAVVGATDEFFGLGRMYQALRDDSPVEVRVFRSLAPAEAWLELPADYFDRLVDVTDESD